MPKDDEALRMQLAQTARERDKLFETLESERGERDQAALRRLTAPPVPPADTLPEELAPPPPE